MLPVVKTMIDLTLGDGYIGGSTNKGYFFQCSHSIKQKEYVDHKLALFNDLGFNPIYREVYKENSYGKYFCGFRVYNTHAHTAKKYLYNVGVKTIDKSLLSVLDRKSLAYWFMDDGCVDHVKRIRFGNGVWHEYEQGYARAYRIATNAHTLSELNLLCDWFLEKYSIVAKPTKCKNQHIISITQQKSRDIFRSLIESFVIPSMQYKIQYVHSLKGIPYVEASRD